MDPAYGFFKYTSNRVTLYPSPDSVLIPGYLYHFKMFGRFVAKGLLDKWLISFDISPVFIKNLLKKPLVFKDLEELDQEYSRNLLMLF